MKRKLTLSHCFHILFLAVLYACGPQTGILPAETRFPTVVPLAPLPTSTQVPLTVIPSPLLIEPVFPVITPDPIQIERWKEYESALAQAFFGSVFQPEEIMCEWQILGRTDNYFGHDFDAIS